MKRFLPWLVLALMLPGAELRAETYEELPENLHVEDRLETSQRAHLVGVWLGEFRQYDPGRFLSYPMRLEVDPETEADIGSGRFSATLHWPTLRRSITEVSGFRGGNMLEFTEDGLLQGGDIVLHGDYRASFRSPDRIEGTWTYPDRGSRGFGTFVLERTALPREGRPAKPGWLMPRKR